MFSPHNIKRLPSKVAHNPLDQQFSVQQVFANSLKFYDVGTIAFHYTVLNYLYSATDNTDIDYVTCKQIEI